MRAVMLSCLGLLACAPLDDYAPRALPDATFVASCDGGACACGRESMACCETLPRCGASLRCVAGTCQREAPRCVATGIFQAGYLTADFVDHADAGTPPCSEIPRELSDPTTPGTFRTPAPSVGALECEGLTPGEYTLRLTARVRALSPYHSIYSCHCNGLYTATLTVTQRGGPTWTIRQQRPDDGPVPDVQCNRGPDVAWSERARVLADGGLTVTVDLTNIENGGDVTALFLRGTSLTLDEVTR